MLRWLRGRPPATLFIGATGGSGTRALSLLLGAADVFLGKDLNPAGDAMAFEPFLTKYIDRFLTAAGRVDYDLGAMPDELRHKPVTKYRARLDEYRRDAPRRDSRVVVKNPRNMFILPVIAAACPDARFLHVVRDGRDMAFSRNQNQLRRHYQALFGEAPPSERDPVASIRLWSRANVEASRAGRRLLGDRYRVMRLEDLCADPVARSREVLDLIGCDPGLAERVAAQIQTPSSFGRFRDQDPSLQAAVADAGAEGLAEFGYA